MEIHNQLNLEKKQYNQKALNLLRNQEHLNLIVQPLIL